MTWSVRSLLLVTGAIGAVFLFRAVHLPAAWLFGPLLVSAIFAVNGWEAAQVPNSVYLAAQATQQMDSGGPPHAGSFLL